MALAPGSLTRPGRLGTLEKTTLTRGKSVDKSQVITLLETTKRTGPESRGVESTDKEESIEQQGF